ncbi:hypothetical protein TanjilG_04998 [Lupinus angustifolius]|uniref:DEP domain-containing protein n=1 Tax=Lupinus angustifolius TaxID=3871 RepID=A0A4P1R577_LUPAN|nr:PREDICTED: uncharacterized protein LOC109359251 [Lupinus angustifolius]OIW02405.1 hypothetical protein TanjilG_04998 [Lupinus angustifolius]
MEKEELAETKDTSPQAVEKLKGDSFIVQHEDQDKESKDVETLNIAHDGPEFDHQRDDISDQINSQVDENLDEDAFTTQNEDRDEESKDVKTQNVGHDDPEFDNEQDGIPDKVISQAEEKLEGDTFIIQNEDQDKESREVKTKNVGHDGPEFVKEEDGIPDKVISQSDEELEGIIQNENQDRESEEVKTQNIGHDGLEFASEHDISNKINEMTNVNSNSDEEIKGNEAGESKLAQRIDESRDLQCRTEGDNFGTSNVPGELFQMDECNSTKSEIQFNDVGQERFGVKVDDDEDFESKSLDNNSGQNDFDKEKDGTKSMKSIEMNQNTNDTPNEEINMDPVFDGTEVPGIEVSQSTSTHNLDANQENPRVVEKAVALKNFVREKSIVAVSILLRGLSLKRDGCPMSNSEDQDKDGSNLSKISESKEVSEKTDQREDSITEGPPQPIAMKGRIIVYTRLACQECKEVRQFLYVKRLRYVEINIDVYPSRKMELEKNSGSTSVPKVFFNEILIGGLSEIKTLNESGKFDEKIDFLITEAPPFEAPLPPLSGEDDVSTSGALDEMALIVRKMKESIVVKDRFSKMRRFTNCFLGFEAVDFLSADQYLERKEAVEFARKLASKLFFQHVLDEILFEDGNHLYRFLDDDPIVASQCHNIPRGIITVKPKSMTEIASRLRLISYAMFEAYASEDGRHVDYRSIHGSEEFARYLRIVETLQRVEVWDLSREDKLAFFINLYNMMTIHAILVWGHPAGALERRKLFGEFKYVIGASTYSLSAIQNGILRGNQRPPYNLMKLFGAKDKRSKVALPYPEPLIHFALVCGTRSGPALRCYSPGDIDKELMDAARSFLRSGGVLIDSTAKVAYASKILKWFSVDFGKNEAEILKHVSNYLDPADSQVLLDLLASSELKVIYQPYDWGLNC